MSSVSTSPRLPTGVPGTALSGLLKLMTELLASRRVQHWHWAAELAEEAKGSEQHVHFVPDLQHLSAVPFSHGEIDDAL